MLAIYGGSYSVVLMFDGWGLELTSRNASLMPRRQCLDTFMPQPCEITCQAPN